VGTRTPTTLGTTVQDCLKRRRWMLTYKSFGRMLAPARDFLLAIKAKHKVDVFCGYRSNCNHAGFQVEPKSLAIFAALDIPFGVSVIVIP